MALKLAEVEPRDYTYVCTPTGDELPDVIDHWRNLEKILNSPIMMVSPGFTLKELCLHEKALPNFRMRFCTKNLKIIPYQSWIMQRLPAVSFVGLRADEEGRAGVEWDAELLLTTRYPLREWGWGEEDVLEYLSQKGVTIPVRTDCARCYAQTLNEWYLLSVNHPKIYADAISDEQRTGHTFRSPHRDTWPADLASLKTAFKTRGIPPPRRRTGGCRICSL